MIEIFYQDDVLIVVNKFVGLVVYCFKMVGNVEEFLIDLLCEQVGGNVYLVYWFDCVISGVLLIVCFSEVVSVFGEQFMGCDVYKQYFVVVCGWLELVEVLIDYLLFGLCEIGLWCEVCMCYCWLVMVEVLIVFGCYLQQCYVLVEVELEIGCFWQICKYMVYIYYLIIGDCQYGCGDYNCLYKQYFGCYCMLLYVWWIMLCYLVSGVLLVIEVLLDEVFNVLFVCFGWLIDGF